MRQTLQLACLSVCIMGLCVSQATAQFCGVSIDCDWDVPDAGYWTFDDIAGGDAASALQVGVGNTAVWQGDVGSNVQAQGIIGGASQTNDEDGGNGTEHYTVSVPELNGAGGLTISLWFNQNVDSNNNSTYNGLFMVRDLVSSFGGGGENWGVALENNGSPRHIDWRIDGVPGGELDNIEGSNQDRWDHVAMTWDGSDVADGMGERVLYVNGVELFREAAEMGTITTSGEWRIGDDACCGSREFTGTLDDLGVWKQALSATDIAQIEAAGRVGVSLNQVEPPQPGDVDGDTDVDIVDFGFIQTNFFTESGATREQGDLTGDTAVEWRDFREWKDNFPTPGAGSLESANVPEPASYVLAGLAVAGLGLLRRKVA